MERWQGDVMENCQGALEFVHYQGAGSDFMHMLWNGVAQVHYRVHYGAWWVGDGIHYPEGE